MAPVIIVPVLLGIAFFAVIIWGVTKLLRR
jgi:hypothetical protein